MTVSPTWADAYQHARQHGHGPEQAEQVAARVCRNVLPPNTLPGWCGHTGADGARCGLPVRWRFWPTTGWYTASGGRCPHVSETNRDR